MSRKPKASSSPTKRGPVIRVAALTNPKTKRTIYTRVTRDGRLAKRDAAKLGVKKVASWIEVEARSWADATKAAKAGKGRKVRTGQERRGGAPLAKAA